MNRKLAALCATIAMVACALAGCSNEDPLRGYGGDGGYDGTIVVGSQDYYSNEIVAEIYAQALERKGYKVDRQFRIGQREAYMPELEAGSIDVFPEYTGSLLNYYEPRASGADPGQVYARLEGKLPKKLTLLDQAAATDQDSYVVTKKFAEKYSVRSIEDLAGIDGLTLGSNSEAETRPYGPAGLKSVYGVDVKFTPIEDSGGPLTLKALRDGQVQLVNVYSANPELASGDLVVLQDPKNIFLAANVVPLVSSELPVGAAKVLDEVSAKLSHEDLVAMNVRSVKDGQPASAIAKKWLGDHGMG